MFICLDRIGLVEVINERYLGNSHKKQFRGREGLSR